jgi:Family of unknown function (DUF5989)
LSCGGGRLFTSKGASRRKMFEFIKELWSFLKERKKFWLLPIIILLLALGSLIIFASGSAIAPFIYTLF